MNEIYCRESRNLLEYPTFELGSAGSEPRRFDSICSRSDRRLLRSHAVELLLSLVVVVSCDSDHMGLSTSATSDDWRLSNFFAAADRRFPLPRSVGCSVISVGTDLRRCAAAVVVLVLPVLVALPTGLPAADDDGGWLKTVDCPKKSISAVCKKLLVLSKQTVSSVGWLGSLLGKCKVRYVLEVKHVSKRFVGVRISVCGFYFFFNYSTAIWNSTIQKKQFLAPTCDRNDFDWFFKCSGYTSVHAYKIKTRWRLIVFQSYFDRI